jgi:hypothetical protein
MLGIHEQGTGSQNAKGRLISSTAYPGYPVTGINSGSSEWRSLQQGAAVAGAAWIGIDFSTGPAGSDAAPNRQWGTVGSINITQSNVPQLWARQVKVEISDGTTEPSATAFSGAGNGSLLNVQTGEGAEPGIVTLTAISATVFEVQVTQQNGTVIDLNTATVGEDFWSTVLNFKIVAGSVSFAVGDTFSISIGYKWTRTGIYNLVQSPSAQVLNFSSPLTVRAVRIIPTLFAGTQSWAVLSLDFLDSTATDINNIQDLFFNENRDRDYSSTPLLLKAQYAPTDSISDLSKFGLNIMDQYSFTVSFAVMVQILGRPIVTGDIIEVIPELQYDHNLRPIRKFLEVTDTGWASEGYSPSWTPMMYRFAAQQALPSQETRDIFGTLDTQKFLVADSVLTNGIGSQLDTTPLDAVQDNARVVEKIIPETGSDDMQFIQGSPLPVAVPSGNPVGQPPAAQHRGKQGIYIEDGYPPEGIAYGEGYSLPDAAGATDGEYFRLSYPASTKLAARLYRFSAVKNRWIYQETDRRGEYSSHRPSVRTILESPTRQPLGKKT